MRFRTTPGASTFRTEPNKRELTTRIGLTMQHFMVLSTKNGVFRWFGPGASRAPLGLFNYIEAPKDAGCHVCGEPIESREQGCVVDGIGTFHLKCFEA